MDNSQTNAVYTEEHDAPPPDYKSVTVRVPHPKWEAYDNAWTENPSLHALRPCLRYWIKFRQLCLRNPLFMYRIPFPYKSLNGELTLGEAILLLVVIGATVAYCTLAVVNKYGVESSGGVSAFVCAAAFALASRNSVFTLILGIPFERALLWHKLLALATVATGWTHGVLGLKKGDDEDKFVSGYVYCGAMSGMLLLSIWPMRRKIFNVFYGSHLVLALVAIISGVAHGASAMLIGVGLWGLDLLIRALYLSLFRNAKQCQAVRLPANVIRLTFDRGNTGYSAGQYVFVMIPAVNIFEWHPFSISSAPHQDKMSLHIRVLGNWTKNLYDKVSNTETAKDLKIFIEGPYGTPEVDVEKYKMFLLISGGIGITPMQSMANSLLHQHEQQGRPMRKIYFIWSCADKYMVSATFEHDREWLDHPPRVPMSFQPDNLARIGSSKWMKGLDKELQKGSHTPVNDDVLHTELYLTRARSESDYKDANILPTLQPFLKFGRPKLSEVFDTMREAAKAYGETHIAAMVCGPVPLIQDVRYHCYKESKNGIKFDFHSELFEF